MPWQAYVDTSLIDSGTVDQAVIFNREGNRVLASSTGFMVSFKEAAEMIKIFGNKGTGPNVIKARNEGFFVAGTLYFAVKADARSLYGQTGDEGVVIINTTQAMIIAHFSSASTLSQAARCVEQLGDHLIPAGY